MAPLTFTCEAALPSAPEAIARQILDLAKWPDFHGYGPIPGTRNWSEATSGWQHAGSQSSLG